MLVKIYWFIELWYLYFLSIFFLYFFVESFVKIVQVFIELVPFLAAINKMIYPAWTQLLFFILFYLAISLFLNCFRNALSIKFIALNIFKRIVFYFSERSCYCKDSMSQEQYTNWASLEMNSSNEKTI